MQKVQSGKGRGKSKKKWGNKTKVDFENSPVHKVNRKKDKITVDK